MDEITSHALRFRPRKAAMRAAQLSLILYLLAATTAMAGCDFRTSQYLDELSDVSAVQKIDFIASNYRKWARNGLGLITSGGEQILERYKDEFNARIIVKYRFGSCEYRAEVQQNGDFKDHVQFRRGRLLQSLNIKLKEGNIAGAVRFKLFLKETRNADSEILGTMLLDRLGFLAPRTRLVAVAQNGTDIQMLWQETPAKEFLERNGRREGPILEGDESVLSHWSQDGGYQFEDLALARLVNDKWAGRGQASLHMSVEAFSRLQDSYANFANLLSLNPSRSLTSLPLPSTESTQMRDAWWGYALAVYSMRGSHALRPHNRKFYWNAFQQGFEPIYYDGEIDISRDSPRYLRDRDRALVFGSISPDVPESLLRRIETIDQEDFTSRYEALCDAGCDAGAARAFLTQFARNLTAYRDLTGDASGLFPPEHRARFADRFASKLPDGRMVIITDVEWAFGYANIRHCVGSACTEECRSIASLLQGLSGMTMTDGATEVMLADTPAAMSGYSVTALSEWGAVIRHSTGARVISDHQSGKLRLKQSAPQDWFLVLGGEFDAVDIVFEGLPPDGLAADESQRFNAFGLTGCLTFHESRFNQSRIRATDGGCEDSVNIVRGRGSLSGLVISGARSDALDVDFSDLDIANVRVERAGNDCTDFSGGRYRLGEVHVQDCGDKGVSVGEASQLEIVALNARSVGIGLSSKDSSRVRVKEMTVRNAAICYEAFQKKQEFFGGHLSFADADCNGAPKQNDENSTIVEEEYTQ